VSSGPIEIFVVTVETAPIKQDPLNLGL